MDYALLTVGSVFTVDVAEERDSASAHVMAELWPNSQNGSDNKVLC